jgi:hypothetical protein
VPNTYVTFVDTSSSGQTEYTIPFTFLQPSDVKVTSRVTSGGGTATIWTYVPINIWNNNLVDGETSYGFGTYSVTFENGVNKIKYSRVRSNVSGGVVSFNITIYRRTAYLNSTYFSNGSPIQASDLNSVLLQNVYTLEETIEAVDAITTFDLSAQLSNKVSKTGDTLTGTLFLSGTGAITGATQLQLESTGLGVTTPRVVLQGGTIQNVPTPAYSGDAVNKAYVDGLTLNGGSQPVITDDFITAEMLRKVTGEEAVTTTSIRNLAINSLKLGNNSVTADKIGSLQVTNAKLATASVTSAKIGTSAVTTPAINDGAVTEAKIASLAVTTPKIANSAITNDKILAGTITSDKLSNQTLDGATLIANNSIPSSKLQNSGISWNNNQVYIDRTYIDTTATEITATGGTLTINKLIKNENLTFLESEGVNQGLLSVLKGSIKSNDGVAINSTTISQFDGGIATLSINPNAINGFYGYNIVVKNPNLLGKPFARTLFKMQGRETTINSLGSPISNKFPTFFYKTIANIPFNYIIDNENPEITLNGVPFSPLTSSGEIIFNNLGNTNRPKKYLITLSGYATSQREGYLYIKSIGDDYYNGATYAPKSIEKIFFPQATLTTARKIPFNVKTIFNLPGNSTITAPVQYFYTDNTAGTPNQSLACGFGIGIDIATPTSGAFAPPSTWAGVAGQERSNDSIVDLLIERIL